MPRPILFGLVFCLPACISQGFGPEHNSGVGEYSGNNNWALLENDELHGGPATGLAKTIEVTIDDQRVSIGSVPMPRATRWDPVIDEATLIIPLQNIGEAQCFIYAEGLRAYDADFDLLDETDVTYYITGSVGDVGGVQTDSCLAPNEIGYLIWTSDAPFASVAFLTIGRLSSGMADEPSLAGMELRQPAAVVTPIAYTIEPSPSTGEELRVTIANSGQQGAYLGTFFIYIMLDADTWPLSYKYLETDIGTTDNILAVGEQVDMIDRNYVFAGPRDRLKVFLTFEDLSISRDTAAAAVPWADMSTRGAP